MANEAMEEQQQWLSIAAVVLVILGLGFFLYRQSRQTEEPQVVTEDNTVNERVDELTQQLQFEVPENADRANLEDISGGSNVGIATRTNEEDMYMYSFLAALPDPEAGAFYEAYLVNTENEEELVYAGKLRQAKGGWMMEYESDEDLSVYSNVRVTREETDDRQPEEVVLEGSFQE